MLHPPNLHSRSSELQLGLHWVLFARIRTAANPYSRVEACGPRCLLLLFSLIVAASQNLISTLALGAALLPYGVAILEDRSFANRSRRRSS